jgi:hypothetical protein
MMKKRLDKKTPTRRRRVVVVEPAKKDKRRKDQQGAAVAASRERERVFPHFASDALIGRRVLWSRFPKVVLSTVMTKLFSSR